MTKVKICYDFSYKQDGKTLRIYYDGVNISNYSLGTYTSKAYVKKIWFQVHVTKDILQYIQETNSTFTG